MDGIEDTEALVSDHIIGTDVDNLIRQFWDTLDKLHHEFAMGGAPYQIMSELVEAASQVSYPGGLAITDALRKSASHPISHFIYQCPFTRHSHDKPRGYAGDADLIDFIYGHESTRETMAATSQTGRAIFAHNCDSPAPSAVRARRNVVAGMIMNAVRRVQHPSILSVACGNAREIELVDQAALERVVSLIGYDQDCQSLAVAEHYQIGRTRITPIQGTIVELLRNRALGDFDIIYAAGLFDYLSDKLSRRLTRNLLSRLQGGGRLLVANFLPGIRDRGYMEAFMHWDLIYRDRAEIIGFMDEISPKEIGRWQYFIESNRNIGFLEIERV